MATTVRYYYGATLIGEGTVAPDYAFDWVNVPAGNYAITSKVFVDGAEQGTSSVVNLIVQEEASSSDGYVVSGYVAQGYVL